MFDESIVEERCPHFRWGIDGNSATCARYISFPVDKPDCSYCDVYREIAGAKVVEYVVEPKECPYCGGDVKTEYSRLSKWWIGCTNDNCPVQPYAEWFSTEEEVIEAWNRRDGFEAPDGYIVLPATKLDEPKPVIFNTDNGVEAKYDLSEVIRQYSKYLADKADYEILTKSLNRAGWFKERTCKVENIRSEGFNGFYVILSCGHRYLTMLSRPFPCCPECGARVVIE